MTKDIQEIVKILLSQGSVVVSGVFRKRLQAELRKISLEKGWIVEDNEEGLVIRISS
jgi:hypothetical protein